MSFIGGVVPCGVCGKRVYGAERADADGQTFHKACMRCAECNCVVKLGSYAALGGKFYCKPHFRQLFARSGNYHGAFEGQQDPKAKWLSSMASEVEGQGKELRRVQSHVVARPQAVRNTEHLLKEAEDQFSPTQQARKSLNPDETDASYHKRRSFFERIASGTGTTAKRVFTRGGKDEAPSTKQEPQKGEKDRKGKSKKSKETSNDKERQEAQKREAEEAEKRRREQEEAHALQMIREKEEQDRRRKEEHEKEEKRRLEREQAEREEAQRKARVEEEAQKERELQLRRKEAEKQKIEAEAKEQELAAAAEKERVELEQRAQAAAALQEREAREKAQQECEERARREQAAKEKAEREKAENERVERERAEKQRQHQEQAAKAKADREEAEKRARATAEKEKEEARSKGAAGTENRTKEAPPTNTSFSRVRNLTMRFAEQQKNQGTSKDSTIEGLKQQGAFKSIRDRWQFGDFNIPAYKKKEN